MSNSEGMLMKIEVRLDFASFVHGKSKTKGRNCFDHSKSHITSSLSAALT